MEALIQLLNLPPVMALLALMTLGVGFVCWKLSKIDSRITFLMKSAEENHAEHEKLWTAMEETKGEVATVRENVGRIQGWIERDRKE